MPKIRTGKNEFRINTEANTHGWSDSIYFKQNYYLDGFRLSVSSMECSNILVSARMTRREVETLLREIQAVLDAEE